MPPKQRRTQANVDRILAAADALVAQRPFSEIAVLDICVEADVSTSSFYARFASKDAVLSALFERHTDVARAQLGEAVAAALSGDADARQVVKLVLSHFVGFVRANEPLMRSIYDAPTLNERYWVLTTEASDALCELLRTVYGVDDPAFRRRLELGVRVAGAAVQRAVGLPMSFGERIGMTDEELVEELGQMLAAYFDDAALLASPV